MLPGVEMIATCPNLAVTADVMHHVVRVESSYNPYAIGVVGGRLVRQPKNLPEALSTVQMLEDKGFNFSLGLAQVNRYNLQKYGLNNYQAAFDKCPNLQAGSKILAECYNRLGDWGKAFSCYYSGNSVTGFRHGYVQKIYASMRRDLPMSPLAPGRVAPIDVVGNSTRRPVKVSKYPVQTAVASRVQQRIVRDATATAMPPGAVATAVNAAPAQLPSTVAVALSPEEAFIQNVSAGQQGPAIARPVSPAPVETVSNRDSAFVF